MTVGSNLPPFQKISVLQHAPAAHLPLRPGDATPTSRNLNPLMHPFSRARERSRALNAAKMERIFSKPFVASLEGHVDSVGVLAKKPGSLNVVASGSGDGGTAVLSIIRSYTGSWLTEILLHDLPQRRHLSRVQAHKGMLTGLSFAGEDRLLSCGHDRTVKLWSVEPSTWTSEPEAGPSEVGCVVALHPSAMIDIIPCQRRKALAIFPGKFPFK